MIIHLCKQNRGLPFFYNMYMNKMQNIMVLEHAFAVNPK